MITNRIYKADNFIMTRDRPAYRTYQLDLPLASLHIMEAGEGPPLIIVPATISELENWTSLVQFMAQWFRVYFFELPGHGQSTHFAHGFSSDLVADIVGELLDRLEIERFNLMGFSFGGVLAMKTYLLLHHRVDRLILNAPCVATRAIRWSPLQMAAVGQLNRLLKHANFRAFIFKLMQNRNGRHQLIGFLHRIGKVENQAQLEEKLAELRPSVLDVIAHELDDILNTEFARPATRYDTPCYFAMSVNDPLLDYGITLDEVQHHFENVDVIRMTFPFHQPPRPFTFDELNQQFGGTVNKFLSAR